MQNIRIKRFLYLVRHRYMTTNNVVVVIAALLAISWAWASVGVVQRNYSLQREVDDKKRQQQLVELEAENLAYEQKYYKSEEYKALEVRTRLGLVDKGEKVVILPPNSPAAELYDKQQDEKLTGKQVATEEQGELQEWLNFLFGGSGGGSKNTSS